MALGRTAGGGGKEEATTTRRSTRLSLLPLLAGMVLGTTATAAVASTVDVSLTVETPAGSPPTLAFTGFPLLVLLAMVAILAVGGALLLTAGRERAGTKTGRGS